jgi:hypothetical protein
MASGHTSGARRGLALGLAMGLILLVAVAACAGSARSARAPIIPRGALIVDPRSLGGRCSDERTFLQVSRSRPWCSLARAFAATPGGHTVLLRAARYPVTSVPFFARALTVTFKPFPGERPVLEGLSVGSSGLPSTNFALVGLTFTNRGLELKDALHVRLIGNQFAMVPEGARDCTGGRPATAHCTSNTPPAVSLAPPMSRVEINGNGFHDGSMGVVMYNGTAPAGPGMPMLTTFQNISIDHNTFSRMGDVVIQVENYEDVKVAFNKFANDRQRSDIDPECHCDAVHAIGGGDRLLLDANLVYGGRGFLIQPDSAGGGNCDPRCLTMTHVVVENNVFSGRDFGLRIYSAPGIKILNNTIEGPVRAGAGLFVEASHPATTRAVVANNLISELIVGPGVRLAVEDYNDVRSRAGAAASSRPGPHDLRARPRFRHPGHQDYGLRPGSPGWNAGSRRFAPRPDPGFVGRHKVSMGAGGAERRAQSRKTRR